MIKEYIAYLKDNPNRYWFKRKLYGWGWVPATWEGWSVLGVYAVLVVGFALTVDERSTASEVAFTFVLPLIFLTITLLRICYRKGEKPKWQWGLPENDPQK